MEVNLSNKPSNVMSDNFLRQRRNFLTPSTISLIINIENYYSLVVKILDLMIFHILNLSIIVSDV